MTDIFNIESKRAIVTGGSKGIGKALAMFLARNGVTTVVFFNTTPLCKELEALHIKGVHCDLQNQQSRVDAFNEALNILGGVDILINCGGIDIKAPAMDFNLADFQSVFNVNVVSLFHMCSLFANYAKDKGGKIINISSSRAFKTSSMGAAYGASKSAVVQLTKNLAKEWAAFNINVNAIAPGHILTDMTKYALTGQRKVELLKEIPMARVGEMEDLQGTLIFLCSKASDYITGITICVDGGYTA